MPINIVAFEIETWRYGILLEHSLEFVRLPRIHPLPKMSRIMEGIVNVRGQVVPVLDIRRRFGLPSKPPHPDQFLLLVRASGRLVAFRNDRAHGLVRIDEQQIEAAETVTMAGGFVAGIAKLANGLVLIHDPGTFLSHSEAQEIDSAIDGAAEPRPCS